MMLAQRVLDCLRNNGPIAPGELANWFRDADRIDFDTTLTRLMRQNSISLTLGKYDLVAQKPNGHAPFVAMASSEPVSQLGCNRDAAPTAAEEAAASLKPAPITTDRFECPGCGNLRFDAEFRHSSRGKRFNICKYCDQRKAQATRHKRAAETINGTDPINGQDGEVAHEAGSLQADSCRVTPIAVANAPVSAKVVEPDSPSISNTHTEATAVSLETSLEQQSPAAADPAAGRGDSGDTSIDSTLEMLAQMRASSLAKRRNLEIDYEYERFNLNVRIDTIDRVCEQLRELKEEGE